MTQTGEGRTLWELHAPRATLTLSGEARLTEPRIVFYRNGRPASTAVSKRASVKGQSRDVTLEEEVVIVSDEEKSTLRTDILHYDSKDRRFHTDSPVVVDRPGARVKGTGMDADSTLSTIRIRDQTTVMR